MKIHNTFMSIFLTLLFFSLQLSPNGYASSTFLPDQIKIVRANWPAEYMGTTTAIKQDAEGNTINLDVPCIQRDENGQIQIGLTFSVAATRFLNSAPDLYLQCIVGDQTVIISADDMTTEYISTEYGNYTNFSTLVTFDLSNYEGAFFDFEFQLVTPRRGNFAPYPILQNSNLFVPWDTNLDIPAEQSINPFVTSIDIDSEIILSSGSKRLCSNISPLQKNNDAQIEASNIELQSNTSLNINHTSEYNLEPLSTQIYPNPFNQELVLKNIPLHTTHIILKDINNQLVYSKKVTSSNKNVSQTINTSDLPKGVYFCQIKTLTDFQVLKVIKQ